MTDVMSPHVTWLIHSTRCEHDPFQMANCTLPAGEHSGNMYTMRFQDSFDKQVLLSTLKDAGRAEDGNLRPSPRAHRGADPRLRRAAGRHRHPRASPLAPVTCLLFASCHRPHAPAASRGDGAHAGRGRHVGRPSRGPSRRSPAGRGAERRVGQLLAPGGRGSGESPRCAPRGAQGRAGVARGTGRKRRRADLRAAHRRRPRARGPGQRHHIYIYIYILSLGRAALQTRPARSGPACQHARHNPCNSH